MYQFFRSVLVALSQNDHERAHELALAIGKQVQRFPGLLRMIERSCEAAWNNRPYDLCGLKLRNRVGIAAGVDKDGNIPLLLEAFGAGFLKGWLKVPA